MPFSDIPNSLVGFLSASAVLLFIHPLVTLGVLIFSIPQFFLNSRFIKKEYELSTELSPLRKTWGWLEGYLLRNRSFLELKLLNLQDYLAHKLKKVVEEVVDKWVDLSKRREFSRFWGRVPLSVFELSLTIVLVYWVILQRITIGTFQLYVRTLRLAEDNLASLVTSFLEIYENYIYVNDLVWFLNLEPQIEGSHEGGVIESTPRVEFKDVFFKYTQKGPWILKKLNFSIKPGETIALVGENGAGKSTLIKLLARFYDPNKGEVLVNDYKLADVNLKSWRKQIAILFQLFELYPFSAREAIGYGDVERIGDFDGVKEAARKTGIDEFIETLPLQYENPVSPEFDKGVMPSIGQWQRFGISRMLFRKDARILILDEPTSNVDPEAEEKIFKELTKLTRNKILIFVTQRFSTVRIADRIFVMHKGEIVESGTHKELMRVNGKYAKLFTLQAQAYLEENLNSKEKPDD
jgi:ABC-type multidrug transport system fused ATPase/permease subunit